MSAPVGSGSGRRRVFARLDRQAVRAHLVDVNDGVIATAGVVEGLLAAGAAQAADGADAPSDVSACSEYGADLARVLVRGALERL